MQIPAAPGKKGKKMEKVDLWIRDDQAQRWEKQSKVFDMSLYEYIRRATDAYTSLINQADGKKYRKNMYLRQD